MSLALHTCRTLSRPPSVFLLPLFFQYGRLLSSTHHSSFSLSSFSSLSVSYFLSIFHFFSVLFLLPVCALFSFHLLSFSALFHPMSPFVSFPCIVSPSLSSISGVCPLMVVCICLSPKGVGEALRQRQTDEDELQSRERFLRSLLRLSTPEGPMWRAAAAAFTPYGTKGKKQR